MLPSRRPFFGAPTRRIPRLAAVAVPAAIVIAAVLFWLNDRIGTPAYWRAALVFLTVIEAAYLGGRRERAGRGSRCWPCWPSGGARQGARRPIAARALLVGRLAGDRPDDGRVRRRGLAASRPALDRRAGGRTGPVVARRSAADVAAGHASRMSSCRRGSPTRRATPRSTWSSWANRARRGSLTTSWLSIGQLVAWKLEEAIPGRERPRPDRGDLGRHARAPASAAGAARPAAPT